MEVSVHNKEDMGCGQVSFPDLKSKSKSKKILFIVGTL